MPRPKKKSKSGYSKSSNSNFECKPEEVNSKNFRNLNKGFKKRLKFL